MQMWPPKIKQEIHNRFCPYKASTKYWIYVLIQTNYGAGQFHYRIGPTFSVVTVPDRQNEKGLMNNLAAFLLY